MTSAETEAFQISALPKATVSSSTEHHPTVIAEARTRLSDVQLRAADRITAFAGSMNFVYLHILIFAAWMIFFERNPWPTLTLVVSLEAIFLSAFVMIGQNRQAAFQQAKADRDYTHSERELSENTEITRKVATLTSEIKALTDEIHKSLLPRVGRVDNGKGPHGRL